MKHFIYLVGALILALTAIPLGFLGGTFTVDPEITEAEPSTSAQAEANSSDSLAVFRTEKKETEEIDFFEYVCGSVAAEMPLSYHEEALKAQAVACYTNALRLKNGAGYKNGSHISDNASIHQGYLSKSERKEKWGKDFEKYESKLNSVVSAVQGEYLSFNGAPCIAAFFALSSGTTESAEDIWGEKIEYLQSVTSHGDKLSPQQITTKTYTKTEFLNICKELGISTEKISSLKNVFKISESTKAGTVLKAKINGKKISGEDIRKAFSLRSAVFTIKATEKSITFTVSGYGHGIGMSQYGADFSARQGSSYQDILKHYYKGTEISKSEAE